MANQSGTGRRGSTGIHETAPLEVGQLIERVVRRRSTVMLTALALTVLAVLVCLLLPRSCTATASVSISPIATTSSLGGTPAKDVDMPTEIATATSRVVAERAAQDLSSENRPELVSELLRTVEVSTPSRSSVLRISVTAGAAETAQQRANALAEAYLADRTQTAEARVKDAVNTLQDSLGNIDADDPARESLERARVELEAASLWSGRIISSAIAPAETTAPGLGTAALAGALGGLMIGLLAALIHDRAASRVGYADRLEDRTGIPTVNATGASEEATVAEAVLALDDQFGISAEGHLLVTTPEGAPAQSVVDEFERQLSTWSVVAAPLAPTRSEMRRRLPGYDAVVVLVGPDDSLGRTSQVLAVLDHASASILPVFRGREKAGRS